MTLVADITFDVNIDAETHRARPQTFGEPPEAEGGTCGVMFFGENGSDDPVVEYINIPGPPGPPGPGVSDAFELALGDDIGTDDESAWSDGSVLLYPTDSTGYAISALNKKLKIVEDNGGSGGGSDGFHIPLGDIAAEGDGSWAPGAVPLDDDTKVSEAVDRLNEVLGKLVPMAPIDFPNGALTLANASGSSPRLAAGGVVDNSGGGSGYAPGGAVNRITATGFSSGAFNDVGPGDSGTLTASVNGVQVASHVLTGAGDAGNYSGLVISDQKDYPPAQPGFWKSIDVALNLIAAAIGINRVQVAHSGAGVTNQVYFVRDGMTAAPAVSAGSVVETTAGTLAYSSGVPHYGVGAQLTVGASMTNLSGETYYGGTDIFTVSGQNGVIGGQAFDYSALGISTPIVRQSTAVRALTPVTVSVNGNTHGAGRVQGSARNVNGASAATDLSTQTILVKRGAAGAKLDEMSVPVSGLGTLPNNNNAVRVGLGAGDTPAGAAQAWVQAAALSTHEAAVVAGVAAHNKTDYSVGYLPVGPNLSVGRDGAQYLTFAFQRTARSAFKINVTGTYTRCWIKLPGVSDNAGISPNAPNGWWDGFLPYDGAGVPGEAGDPLAGCAAGVVMTGASGSFPITFGTQSSTNATDNVILVRFKLAPGQQITALSLSN